MDTLLDFSEYFDLDLAEDNDYDKSIITSNEIIKSDLAFWFDINNKNSFSGLSVNGDMTKLTSISAWTDASVSNFSIHDIGLTGVDTLRVKNLTGESINFTSANTKLELFSVSGSGTTNSYSISSAFTENIGNWISLSGGGGFQGFFTLPGYNNFKIFPRRMELGWYMDQWIKFSGISNNTNSNFFFYMGTRAENKFWNIFSGENGTTTSGVSISPSVSADTFLDTADNVLSFRFSGSSLGVRWLSGTSDCNNVITGVTMQESYSKHGIFDNFSGNTDSDWINVGVRWKRHKTIDQCTISSGTTSHLGDLIFYLNARPVYKIKNFKELIFRSLNVHKTKQQGLMVIGWGFGSFGLKESRTFSGPDNNDKNLTIQNNFDGNLNGGISQLRFYVVPLSVDKIIHNFEIEKGRYRRTENWGGRNIRINKGIPT